VWFEVGIYNEITTQTLKTKLYLVWPWYNFVGRLVLSSDDFPLHMFQIIKEPKICKIISLKIIIVGHKPSSRVVERKHSFIFFSKRVIMPYVTSHHHKQCWKITSKAWTSISFCREASHFTYLLDNFSILPIKNRFEINLYAQRMYDIIYQYIM